jgi:hypothetical protein
MSNASYTYSHYLRRVSAWISVAHSFPRPLLLSRSSYPSFHRQLRHGGWLRCKPPKLATAAFQARANHSHPTLRELTAHGYTMAALVAALFCRERPLCRSSPARGCGARWAMLRGRRSLNSRRRNAGDGVPYSNRRWARCPTNPRN